MHELSKVFLTLGGLFLLGLATDALGRRTRMPRVTLLIVLGFAIGPSALDLLPATEATWFPLISHIALAMIGFVLGQSLSTDSLKEHGREVFILSATIVIASAGLVAAVLFLFNVPLELALVLGGIAAATDPAAVTDVVRESGARGPFTRKLLGIVAVDDAWGLMVFSILLTVAQSLSGNGGGLETLADGAREVVGALLLGGLLGLPMAFLTGRVERGEPTLAEALGFVFLCTGAALWLHCSFLLAAMTMGATVANRAKHHTRPFRAIQGVEWPFLILFFVFAGASLEISALTDIGILGCGYAALRIFGRLVGGAIGGRIAGSTAQVKTWMGISLMPQAGVALGMALVAAHRLPEFADVIMTMTIATTILFEVFGPVVTRMAIRKAGEG
jgi:Kef-type K+ transport system membrane component KefB